MFLTIVISIDPELKLDDGTRESKHIGPTKTFGGESTICCYCIFLACFLLMIFLPIGPDAGGEYSKFIRSKASKTRFHRY